MTKSAMGITVPQLEALCGQWPGVTRDIKWGVDLVLSVDGKMFAVMPSDGSEGGRLSFKVAMARAHWISVIEPQRFSKAELESFVLDAYVLVRAKLTKKLQAALGPLPTLQAGAK